VLVFAVTCQPLHPAFVYGGLQLVYLLFAEEEDDALEIPQVHIAIVAQLVPGASPKLPIFGKLARNHLLKLSENAAVSVECKTAALNPYPANPTRLPAANNKFKAPSLPARKTWRDSRWIAPRAGPSPPEAVGGQRARSGKGKKGSDCSRSPDLLFMPSRHLPLSTGFGK
jgi:hypothetical protein